MKIKIVFATLLLLAIVMLSVGFSYQSNSFTDEIPTINDCPFLQSQAESSCPYLESKLSDSNSGCPYLSGQSKCPYSGKELKKESESTDKRNGGIKEIYKAVEKISV